MNARVCVSNAALFDKFDMYWKQCAYYVIHLACLCYMMSLSTITAVMSGGPSAMMQFMGDAEAMAMITKLSKILSP
jgi:hypothetical protein